MKEKIVIIGANEFQNPLILQAKQRGYETHVFAWEEGAVGKENADYFYPISIIEKEIILEKCRQINPIGIVSIASDLAMLTVNFIADKLGLVGNSLECTNITTNKYAMRQKFEKMGDPSPRYCISDELDKVDLFSYPLIVKPTDRSGSRGIFKIDNKNQLHSAIEEACKQSFANKAIIEEFIEGKEYSVEYISYRGKHYFLALTEKFTTGAPHFIETGHIEPADVSKEMIEKVKKVVEHALNSLLVSNGASHTEIMIQKDGQIKLVEIGARMGGDCIGSDLVRLSTGYDFVGMVIDIACGKEPVFEKVCNPRKVAIRFVFRKEDLIDLEKMKEDKIFFTSPIENTEAHEVVDSSTRFGYYIYFED